MAHDTDIRRAAQNSGRPVFGKALVEALRQQHRIDEALSVIDEQLSGTTRSAELLHLKASVLARAGRTEQAVAASSRCIVEAPSNPIAWLTHGRLLAQAGQKDEARAAAFKAAVLRPDFGPAWWTLADLDAKGLDEADIAAMVAMTERPIGDELIRAPIHFALGRVWEARGEGGTAFGQYARGHALRRTRRPYDPATITQFVDRTIAAPVGHADTGIPSSAPIFIVGMHRAGSTLVEQILASHPAVEGLAELPHIGQIAQSLAMRQSLHSPDPEQAKALGEAYLSGVAPYRQTDRPHFVDKMPGNWRFIPLIRLLLPNARIIDVRRDPLDCCISNFCRYYANGQEQADDLADLGRYYRDYVRFMDHLDSAMPGAVHRVVYEDLVDDLEGEVRALLSACDLPFDADCLRFHQSGRTVRTPSAQQVRRPINRDGIGRWRLFAPWLDPLVQALGPLVQASSRSPTPAADPTRL